MKTNSTKDRKNINLSENMLIKQVEDKFRESSKFKTYAGLSDEEYDKEYTSMLLIAKRDNYKLCSIDAEHLAEIFFLNNKKGFEQMIIDFYLEHQYLTNIICNIEDIEKAKTKIKILTFGIASWLNNYLKEKAKSNRDLASLFQKT